MAAPKLSAPLTLRQLAERLGPPWDSRRASSLRRLRNLIVRRERALRREGHDVTLYHCTGERSTGWVTLAELFGWMEELRPKRDELAAMMRQAMGDLLDRVRELDARDRLMAKKIVELEKKLRMGA